MARSQTRTSRRSPSQSRSRLTWPKNTELLGLSLDLQPQQDAVIAPQYAVELHSWFLDQVRRRDAALSTTLHDGQQEKPFTVSQLWGPLQSQGRQLLLQKDERYQWTITALSPPVIAWFADWLRSPPAEMRLRSATLTIHQWAIAQPPLTYARLLKSSDLDSPTVTLSFLSPTSFRRKGHHLPLPWPPTVFQSYLRRWNDFSGHPVDADAFLTWVDESVIILRHQLQSAKVLAGKRGSVTGFTGAIEFGLTARGRRHEAFRQIFGTLGQLAPYCGTGHKTTFGLGQTRLGWLPAPTETVPLVQDLLAQRITELTELFTAQRKRIGGDRAAQIATTWATILARRELGESLQAIAQDLEMPYETVKTYSKLARRAIRDTNSAAQ